jgi:hypothetical protein
MENLTLEQLIATFGPEVGQQMYDQMNASTGGNQAPFPFVKKISDMDSELGAWGDHVVGTTYEKNEAGERVVVDKGTNLGKSFDIVIVNIGYHYSRWNDEKQRTESSNAFTDLSKGIKTAVNSYTGEPLPATKEAKKKDDWKMVKQMGVLVRKDAKSPWIPAIYEVSGKTYFTLGELVDSRANKGLLDGLYTLVFKKERKGSTTYTIIDTEKSKIAPLPSDLFTNEETKGDISEITKKMTEYRAGQQYSATGETPVSSNEDAPQEDNVEW